MLSNISSRIISKNVVSNYIINVIGDNIKTIIKNNIKDVVSDYIIDVIRDDIKYIIKNSLVENINDIKDVY